MDKQAAKQIKIHDARRRNLEDAFFSKQDAKLIEQLRIMEKMKASKDALKEVSGITNEAVLEKLASLNMRPETLASLAIVPLVEIAWADGKVDDNERDAILKAMASTHIFGGGIDHELVQSWMEHSPPPKLFDAWIHFIQGLHESLSNEETKNLRDEIVGHAKAIAQASGGFLGMGNKISKAEQVVIDRLTAAFDK